MTEQTAARVPLEQLVPEDAHVLGDPAAPVTIVEFGDLECPYCAAAAPVLRDVVASSAGRVRLVFRHFPLFEIHPYALTAALAVEAADAHGRFWEMHEALFAHQDRLDDAGLAERARELGIDGAAVVGDAAQQFAAVVQRDYADALALGVQGTPTLFVDGVRYRGRVTREGLEAAVAALPAR
ncbi:thioredoxin domain-containing protein [Cellulosimicrobium sp. CUA-896]|uniref:DsbA family protein n=1 Tax=Cellulosimicrobium sp. CUA-896 TaxID=1517881 RepID=UPI00096957D1|nr:thioredoxin domain-containing protein [Cellulosimicrobium sp. CUA-896]OLT53217.1 disulfide bond formation protein DsbA [Cellulosimicrobium sp. CUA-896]